MRKIVSLILGAGAITLVSSATPAMAQTWRPDARVTSEIRQEITQLDRQIARAEQRKTISRREAVNLRSRADRIEQSYQRFQRGGLSRQEIGSLEQQVNQLRQQLRLEKRDWNGRRG